MKTILLLCCAVVLTVQASDSQTITNWDESVQGVQMAITMTNSVITKESRVPLFITVTNASKYNVNIMEEGFTVLLNSDSGKAITLISPPPIYQIRHLTSLGPGESHVWNILTTLGENLDSGSYALQASVGFSAFSANERRVFGLSSNLLKVQVK
jgi:hypothetical protein